MESSEEVEAGPSWQRLQILQMGPMGSLHMKGLSRTAEGLTPVPAPQPQGSGAHPTWPPGFT